MRPLSADRVAPPPRQHPRRAAAKPGRPACGRELGRWITPFKRCGGRWLTDASAKLPLLPAGQRCAFVVQSASYAGVWTATLTLRFSGGTTPGSSSPQRRVALEPAPGAGLAVGTLAPPPLGPPTRSLPLPWAGGAFDDGYNPAQPPFAFTTPHGLRRAVVEGLVTGALGRGRLL